MANKVQTALANRLVIVVLTTLGTSLGAFLATASPAVYHSICGG